MDLIKVKNEGYARYEELLLRREKLNKEAYWLMKEYIREFGQLIEEDFRKKIDCIQKKKTIDFCQATMNRGQMINAEELVAFLDKEMKEYNETLRNMIKRNNETKDVKRISQTDVAKIKKLYRKLAKQLHPDMHPKTAEIPELMALWQSVATAYAFNNLKELEEMDVLVQAALKKLDLGCIEIEIPDIQTKIKEIQQQIMKIKTTEPYTYKNLLQNEQAVEKKKQEMRKEIEEYKKYELNLDRIIAKMMAEGDGRLIWTLS